MKETITYLNSLLKPNDTIVIGLSGGPDSMCLLNILISINKNINIICAHINHNIREDSKKELDFIKKYCQNKNIKLETTTFEKKSTTSNYNELELREKRYEFFEQIINKYQAIYLFTAHHGDDLIETIEMRLTRGSNLKGYSGFQVCSNKEHYQIIKPLIFMTKDEITEYNKKNNIPFVNDYTNDEDHYTRNRYRHHLLPFLKKENKNVHLKFLKFSHELTKYYEFVNAIVLTEIEKRYQKNVLEISNFSTLDELIQIKIIEYILDDNYEKNLYLVQDKHVNMILKIISNKRPNIEINLPDNLKINKSYNQLFFTRKNNEITDYNIKIEDETLLPNNHKINIIKEIEDTSNNCLRLNTKEIKMPLYVRTRKNGDKITIKNMEHAKKVKDIYINSKLSPKERLTQPVVIDSNNTIIWLPGLKKSKFDKSKSGNYDIILWYN